MARYFVMTPDGTTVLSAVNSACSFYGAISSFVFSASVYSMTETGAIDADSQFFPPNIIIAKKTTLRGKISGRKYTLFRAVGDTEGKDTLFYKFTGPVDLVHTRQNLEDALTEKKIEELKLISPSEILARKGQ